MIELSIIQKIAIWALPVLFAITVHEVAHGWVASWLGDYTAKLSGRLTLNPIKHMDVMGTIIVPLVCLAIGNVIFGWAKPVPIDPRNFRNRRRDTVIVSLAGPMSNFLMAFGWAVIAKVSMGLAPWFGVPLFRMGMAGIQINIVLGVLNCLPIPPLDGGQALANMLPPRAAWYFSRIEPYGFFILLFLLFTQLLSYILLPPIAFLVDSIVLLFGL